MQQGGGGTQYQYGEMTPAAATTATTSTHTAQQQPVEAASPISCRPPATSVTSSLDEFIRLSGGGDEDEGDRAGGVASGNRWPRQETLALLKIRSDMDAAFRDATVKGPLWEDVSRKLSELGYKRSAKKCKEKFENVHKYYKRTKEGRAGRQDGKNYKFFNQLEALQSSTSSVSMPVTTVTLDVAPVSVGIPMPISSGRIPTSLSHSVLGMSASSMFPTDLSVTIPTAENIPGSTGVLTTTTPPTATTTTTNNPIGINFSSDSDSSSHESEDDDDEEEEMDLQGQPSNTVGSSHKRKRQSSSSSRTTHTMMEFFESLMKQVMQKQETMQQRFLDVIEKREQDRMIREQAWKRQETARLAREHEVMTQERVISASRDAAIISFLQKITGQTIQLPPAVTMPAAPPQTAPVVVVPAVSLPTSTHHLTPSSLPQERRDQQNQQLTQSHHRHQQQQLGKSAEMVRHQAVSTSIPSQIVMAIPEQQIPPSQEIGSSGRFESSSSRWPKVEVLALIKLRSGLEPRYQEAGPKGPLWEEISAGMQRTGYNRSAKRCKEKWENINKYFKKVKESNKKRPEDAKTCPYFHELDALYRKNRLGGGSASGGGGGGTSTSCFNISKEQHPQQHQQESLKLDPTSAAKNPHESGNVLAIMPTHQLIPASESDNKNTGNVDAQASNVGLPGSLFGEGNRGASNKPEDIVKELMNQQGMQQRQRQPPQQSIGNDFDKIEESNIGSDSDNMDHEEEYDEAEDEDQDELEEERKMAYKVKFQRQDTNASNGGGNGAASFLAMVQ